MCIRKWNKKVFKNIFDEKKNIEQEMEEIQKKWIQGIHPEDLGTRNRKSRQI
jgi:hypothetical protein